MTVVVINKPEFTTSPFRAGDLFRSTTVCRQLASGRGLVIPNETQMTIGHKRA